MERGRRLQLRRRMLCQVHQALQAERAANLECVALRLCARERNARSELAYSRLQRRQQDGEYARRISGRLRRQCGDPGNRGASKERRVSDRRRVRCPSSDREVITRAGHVSLPLRIYRQSCGDGSRRERTVGDVLNLLWIAVFATCAESLCGDAGTALAGAQSPMLAG